MTKVCIWSSSHIPMDEQIEELKRNGYNVIFLSEINPDLHKRLMNTPETTDEILDLANEFLDYISSKFDYADEIAVAQPAGNMQFQYVLGKLNKGITMFYSHSVREVMEVLNKDGVLEKTSIFKHSHFVKI